MLRRPLISVPGLLTTVALVALASCSANPPGEAPPSGVAGEGPLYLLATAVSGDDSATTYLKVSNQVPQGEVDLLNTREFPGWSDVKVSGGKIFVSSGESPIVSRFAVAADGSLQKEGEIGFANHAMDAAMYQHVFISPEKAYLLGDGGDYVIWNPSTMEILGTIAVPRLPVRDGVEPAPSLDRGMIVRDGRLYHAVAYSNYETYKMFPESNIVVVDVVADRFVESIAVPCPDLNVATEDPAGNLIFSNWVYSPAATLVHGGANACLVKIPAGQTTIDPASVVAFKDVTGGHEAAAVSVLANGRAIVSVFYEDNQPFDPSKDDIFDWVFGANWKTVELDLTRRTTTELRGLDWHGGGYYTATFDDTDYLLLPGKGYTTTQIYELDPQSGARLRAQTKGWATRLFRLR